MVRTQTPIKWTSLLLILAMLFTLMPVQQANANTGVAFTFDGYSTDPSSPTQRNSDTIDIRGTFFGVAADSITYKVERIVNDKVQQTLSGTGVSPIIEGTNRFYFPNVKIFDGLNKVTVSGNSTNGVQSNSFYVYFPNVPSIYEISLSDGRELPANKPVLVTTKEISLMFRAPNATSVTVQGKSAFSGGGDLFLVSGIEVEEGLNTLVFSASNSTMTYTVTRDVVRLFNIGSTAYDIAIENNSGNPKKVQLDSKQTVGSNVNVGQANESLSGNITGKITLPKYDGVSIDNLTVEIFDHKSNNTLQTSNASWSGPVEELKLTVTSATYDYAIYSFTSDDPFVLTDSGQYSVRIKGDYDTAGGIAYSLKFDYRTSNSPYLSEVLQAYNVKETTTSGVFSYTSSSVFTDGLTFFQAPIWLALNVENYDETKHTIEIDSTQYGVTYTAPVMTYEKNNKPYYTSTNGELLFKITNLPAGEQTLNIRVKNNSAVEDEWHYKLTFIPTPFIQLDNLYDGQNFTDDSEFTSVNNNRTVNPNGPFVDPTIKGKLINFNLANSNDISSLSVTINGTTKTYASHAADYFYINQTTGEFEFNNAKDASMKLVNGPNSIVISANANGIPITTHIIVYLFPKNMPEVKTLYPVPVGANADTDNIFKSTGTLTYSTNAKTFEVLFSVVNADSVVVNIDGQQHVVATRDTNDPTTFNISPSAKLQFVERIGTEDHFRLVYTTPAPTDTTTLQLPDSGTKSVTITAVAGTTTNSKTLQITRIRVPYIVHSPKLPNEQVINQNFLTVAIEAEGADQILLGKEPMEKGTDGIFRLELNNLKSGNNTIKFTIFTGSEKQDGSFTVTYATQNEVGAQYQTTIPSSGKISVFNGALQLTFPKGTMLKQPQQNISGVPTQQINLFNSQKLLFGIADRNDGRTVKRYNRAAQVGNGTGLADVSGSSYISSLLQSISQFGYASQLYWVDAGFFDTSSTEYKTVDGLHPYATNNDIFSRSQNLNKWLVPTNRGTIVLKYDSNIRNESAKNLSVWRFDGTGWTNLGGVVNTGNKTVTASFDGFGYYAVMNMRYSFDDVIGHPYARNHINTLFAKGIMQARSNSAFGAYENITRGEFATMIVKILDLPLNYDTSIQQLTFSDVSPAPVTNAMWDYRYIETAARAGIVSGLTPRQFAPGSYLTREQAAVIIARALNYKLGTVEKDRASLAKQFVDAGLIDHYAVTSVQAIVKEKIMSGIPNPMEEGQKKQTFSFSPKANLNRADMAVISYNILTKLKRI